MWDNMQDEQWFPRIHDTGGLAAADQEAGAGDDPRLLKKIDKWEVRAGPNAGQSNSNLIFNIKEITIASMLFSWVQKAAAMLLCQCCCAQPPIKLYVVIIFVCCKVASCSKLVCLLFCKPECYLRAIRKYVRAACVSIIHLQSAYVVSSCAAR